MQLQSHSRNRIQSTLPSRLKAFAVHLSISICIAILVINFLITLWYPGDLFMVGASAGLIILLSVDLVIGPILTLLIYDPRKKSLLIDIAIIAFIQIGLMLWGIWLIYNERPVAQVINHNGVNIIAHSDVEYFGTQLPNSKTTGASSNNIYLMQGPTDKPDAILVELNHEILTGKPFIMRTDLYLPIAQVSDEEISNRLSNANNGEQIHFVGASTYSKKFNCTWTPLVSKHAQGHACVNRHGVVKISSYRGILQSLLDQIENTL